MGLRMQDCSSTDYIMLAELVHGPKKKTTSWNQWNKQVDKMSDDNRVTDCHLRLNIKIDIQW